MKNIVFFDAEYLKNGGGGCRPAFFVTKHVVVFAHDGGRGVSRKIVRVLATTMLLMATANASFAANNSGGADARSDRPAGACQNSMGKDDTIGGRTGPPGTAMINSGKTGTPNIATNLPCGPK